MQQRNIFRMFRQIRFLGFVTICLFICVTDGNGTTVEEDLTITYEQKNALDQFRRLVEQELPHSYMKKDIYLIRWLRAKNFDIRLSRSMLLENLQWRSENQIDTIQDEDWSDYESRYKIWIQGKDKEGKPIMYMNFGSWDVQRATEMGEREKVIKYINRAMEMSTEQVRNMQDMGMNVTQVNFIMNMDGYSVTQHGCLQCLSVYIAFMSSYENHYPGQADRIILFNTPQVFGVVLDALKPFMSPQTRNAFKIYGTNETVYEEALLNIIDQDQLPHSAGGTDNGTLYGEDEKEDINIV